MGARALPPPYHTAIGKKSAAREGRALRRRRVRMRMANSTVTRFEEVDQFEVKTSPQRRKDAEENAEKTKGTLKLCSLRIRASAQRSHSRNALLLDPR